MILKLDISHLAGKFNVKIMLLLCATNFHFAYDCRIIAGADTVSTTAAAATATVSKASKNLQKCSPYSNKMYSLVFPRSTSVHQVTLSFKMHTYTHAVAYILHTVGRLRIKMY